MKKPNAYASDSILNELVKFLESKLDKCGLYYRLFARYKTDESIKRKLAAKNYSHETGYLMQDFIGIRIALYFCDDIPICRELILSSFDVLNISETRHSSQTFEATRLNLVCKIPDQFLELFESHLWTQYPFDKTFEVQIRTVFSEGWHEVEHDVRYKCKEDWVPHADLDRTLNGILATLENCDWSILALVKDLAYREYKSGQWSEMMKNKMRIHLANTKLSDAIISVFNGNTALAKKFYRCDRQEILLQLLHNKLRFPLTADNMIYFINTVSVNSPEISEITPPQFLRFVDM